MVTKKAKKVTRVRKKQCDVSGCRKGRVDGSTRCSVHDIPEEEDPIEVTKRLTEVERLRFFEADIAMRNHAQEIKILDQEQRLEQVEFDRKKQTRQHRVNELRSAIEMRTVEQRAMLVDYGRKYDFNPKFVSIDDKTGTIQDHTPEE